MKKMLALVFLSGFLTVHAQKHKLTQLWATDQVVATPESVLPDNKTKMIYISLIDGDPWGADGKGGVAKLSLDGKNYDSMWVTGMNAPKGLAISGNRLYAADITNVVVIEISKGKIEKQILIEGSSGLNDITAADDGVLYVSDSKASRIFRLKGEKSELYLDNIPGANGVKAIKKDLYFAKGSALMKADEKKNITQIADVGQGIDGIEPVGNGDFLVTSWSGYIFYVYANGTTELLLDTHEQKKNTADIGYDPVNHIVYVPTFFDRRVVAYQLSGL